MSELEIKKEEHDRRPFFLNAAGMANGAIWAVLYSSIFFYIAYGRVTAVLYPAIFFNITYGRIACVLYPAIVFKVTDGLITAILYRSITLYVTHCWIAAVTDGTIDIDGIFGSIITGPDGLRIGEHREQ